MLMLFLSTYITILTKQFGLSVGLSPGLKIHRDNFLFCFCFNVAPYIDSTTQAVTSHVAFLPGIS